MVLAREVHYLKALLSGVSDSYELCTVTEGIVGMKWEGRRQSSNLEDRRGEGGVAQPLMIGGGLGTVLIMIVLALLGVPVQKLGPLLNQMGPPPQMGGAQQGAPGAAVEADPAEERLKDFVGTILADTEDVWTVLFEQEGKRYETPKLVLFRGGVRSACGAASAAVGPFYCPADQKVYLDLGFYEDLERKLDAPGEFPRAYVIAHEIGHHVQNLLGLSDQLHNLRGRVSEEEYNQQSVRLELHADFLAGVWAHHLHQKWGALTQQDIQQAMGAASAIGDDQLQKKSQGYVVPDSFTHGSSEQRVRWFMRGFKSGQLSDGNTFDIPYERL